MKLIFSCIIIKIFLIDFLRSQNFYELSETCKNNDTGINCILKFSDTEQNSNKIDLNIQKPLADNTKVIKELEYNLETLKDGILHLTVKDKINPRYEVPRNILKIFETSNPKINVKQEEKILIEKLENKNFFENYSDSQNFSDKKANTQKFTTTLIDPLSKKNLFDLFKNNFEYSDDYITFDYLFPSDDIFGYGERSAKFKLPPGVYTIWPKDYQTTFDDGKGARSSYGSQPFIMVRNPNPIDNTNSYIGIIFLNSNAQDLYIDSKNQDGKTKVRQVTIGGIIELLVWSRPTPLETIQVLHSILGNPTPAPLWALGWHQCRWGYKSTNELKSVVDNYKKNNIPLDTIWSDIDYMDNYQDFTYDTVNFKDLPIFVKNVKNDGLHFVPIIDIGIPYQKDNFYYKLGKEKEIFIKSNYTNDDLINPVWPKNCVFPDFTNYEKTKSFWQIGLENLSKNLDVDGIWLDMNEPAGFVDGEVNIPSDPAKNKYSSLTYSPGNKRDNYDLNFHSISVNSLMNPELAPFNHLYNLKAINVFYQNKMTNDFLNKKNKRPFILSRSSYLGMGRYANHWLGDNVSDYKNMTSSISSIFNFQMFGFNLVGVDICGFNQDTTDDLCARWHNLGAFYPFSRNHNAVNQKSQEPWAVGKLTFDSSRNAIRLRYSLLRYFYTQLFLSSIKGGVFFQPLFFQFPNSLDLISNDQALNYQAMVGPALLLIPQLTSSTDEYMGVFPAANWNYFPSGKLFLNFKRDFNGDSNKIINKNLSGQYSDINLFIRGGYIVPHYATEKNEKIQRTAQLEQTPMTLVINPDENLKAFGEIIYDDPNSLAKDVLVDKKYNHLRIEYDGLTNKLDVKMVNMNFDYKNPDFRVNCVKVLNFGIDKFNKSIIKMKKVKKINNVNATFQFENYNLIVRFDVPVALDKMNMKIKY